MKLFLNDTNKLLRIPDSDKIMLGDECCCEWIAFQYSQEGMYDCERGGEEFIYDDPDVFCGTPFEITKTATAFNYKFNFEASTYCGRAFNNAHERQKGVCFIKLFITSPMTLEFTGGSLYNNSNLYEDTTSFRGREVNSSQLQLITVESSTELLEFVVGESGASSEVAGCGVTSTVFNWDEYPTENPFTVVLPKGLFYIVFQSSAYDVFREPSPPDQGIKDIISSDEYDLIGVQFSRNIPPEVDYGEL